MADPVTRNDTTRKGSGFTAPLRASRYAKGGALEGFPASALDADTQFFCEVEDFNYTEAGAGTPETLNGIIADDVNTATAETIDIEGSRSSLIFDAGSGANEGVCYTFMNQGAGQLDRTLTGTTADPTSSVRPFNVVDLGVNAVPDNSTYVVNWKGFLGLGTSPTTLTAWSSKAFVGAVGDFGNDGLEFITNTDDVVTFDQGGAGFHIDSSGDLYFVHAGVATNTVHLVATNYVTSLGGVPAITATSAFVNVDNLRKFDFSFKVDMAKFTVTAFVGDAEVYSYVGTIAGTPGTAVRPAFGAVNGTSVNTKLVLDTLVTGLKRQKGAV